MSYIVGMESTSSKKKCHRRQYNGRQRAEILSEHRASGESVVAYCKRIGLSISAFYRWRHASLCVDGAALSEGSVTWSELALPESEGKVEVYFPNKIRLRIEGAYDLAAVVEALHAC